MMAFMVQVLSIMVRYIYASQEYITFSKEVYFNMMHGVVGLMDVSVVMLENYLKIQGFFGRTSSSNC